MKIPYQHRVSSIYVYCIVEKGVIHCYLPGKVAFSTRMHDAFCTSFVGVLVQGFQGRSQSLPNVFHHIAGALRLVSHPFPKEAKGGR